MGPNIGFRGGVTLEGYNFVKCRISGPKLSGSTEEGLKSIILWSKFSDVKNKKFIEIDLRYYQLVGLGNIMFSAIKDKLIQN